MLLNATRTGFPYGQIVGSYGVVSVGYVYGGLYVVGVGGYVADVP